MRVLLAMFVLALVPAAAAAALPDELSRSETDRAAWRGLSGVYRLDAEFAVPALATSLDERVSLGDGRVAVTGTAFGVATGGFIVTADHLVGGSSETLAIAALAADQGALAQLGAEDAEEWVRANAARPVDAQLIEITLRQVGSAGDVPGATARLIRRDRSADIALLQATEAKNGAALPLADDRSQGTPVVGIGFGKDRAEDLPTVPGIRTGELSRSGPIEGRGDQIFIQTTIPVSRGDPGGPVLDLQGRVRGMVVSGADAGSNIAPARAVQELVGQGRTTVANPVHESYLAGLESFWALDFRRADRSFATAREADPTHALSARFAERTGELQRARISLTGSDGLSGFLRMLGIVSAVMALVFGLALVRHDLSRRRFMTSTERLRTRS